MALPLPVNPAPVLAPPARPVFAEKTPEEYKLTADGLGFTKYVSGEAVTNYGFTTEFTRPVDQPGANYFTPMREVEAVRVVFQWVDLSSFFWWNELPGTVGVAEQPPNYFPAGERVTVESSVVNAERIELEPSVVNAERLPNPEYEVE